MEDAEARLIVVGVCLCLFMLAFTSAADAAFTSISRHRLNALLSEGGNRAKRVSRLMDDPQRFKATILFLNISMTIIITGLILRLSSHFGFWGQAASLGLLLLGILVFGESIPKAIAVRNPDATALALADPLRLISRLLWPLLAVINWITRPIFSMISGQPYTGSPLVTEEELRLLVNVGEEEGLIEHEEREMIEGVMAFGDTLLREIMVPRVDIVALEVESSLEKALDIVVTRGHSRIPVYRGEIDNIVGILYAKDLIPTLRDVNHGLGISGLLRPAHFVPETMKVNALLEDLQKRKVHMAIMVDEYGGTAGLATIEDLIEQIVGEIQDEYDTEEPSIQPIGPGEYIVDARVTIGDINDLVDLELSAEGADRIGGLVYEQLGRIPRVGDELQLDDATISVLSVKGVRAQKLRIIRKQPVGAHTAEEELIGDSVHDPA